MLIDLLTASWRLLEADQIVILCHVKPDGDTLGSGYALYHALRSFGKQVRIECGDNIPRKYHYFTESPEPEEFTPKFVVAVDVADANLLGSLKETYPAIDLCVDHHKSNTMFAKETCLDSTAAATAQIIYGLILRMEGKPVGAIADALYTGITTDTGCFRYSNVTAETHRIAADLINFGAQHAMINRLMFETKSRGRLQVDRLMLETMEFALDDQVALLVMPQNLAQTFGVSEEDLEGIAALPRTIEGVLVGVTIREKDNDLWRVSFRTQDGIDASNLAQNFGGGGHKNAAGCTLEGSLNQVKENLVEAIKKELERSNS